VVVHFNYLLFFEVVNQLDLFLVAVQQLVFVFLDLLNGGGEVLQVVAIRFFGFLHERIIFSFNLDLRLPFPPVSEFLRGICAFRSLARRVSGDSRKRLIRWTNFSVRSSAVQLLCARRRSRYLSVAVLSCKL
jgi:hypothetical protein